MHNIYIFTGSYALVSLVFAVLVFFLSKSEGKKPIYKTLLTVIYIIALMGIVFALTVFENYLGFNKIISTVIAAVSLGVIYLADVLGGKLKNK